MSTGRIRIKKFEDGTIGLVLWSGQGHLLLAGQRVASSQISQTLDEFVRHCGLAQCYRTAAIPSGGQRLELISVAGQCLAWSMPCKDEVDLERVRTLAMQQGPFAQVDVTATRAPSHDA